MRQDRSRRDTGRALTTASLTAAFFVLCAGGGEAGTVSYREGDGKGLVSQTDDTRLAENTPDTNFGAEMTCVIDDTPAHEHCTLKFPNIFGGGIDQIPPGSSILNATLTVFVEDSGTECPTMYQLTEGWKELEATWNSRATAQPWTSPGAEGVGSHRAVAEGILPCSSPFSPESLDVTRSVQSWSSGSANEGWVIVNANVNDAIKISTSAIPTMAQRPLLTISFVPTVFYSVGVDPGDLKTGAPTISIIGSTATLSTPQLGNVGVGDVIDFDSPPRLVYISSVISPSEFTVQRADGSTPAPAVSLDVNSITRAFNSIDAAVAGSSDAVHLNTTDLAGTFRRLTWVLYDDGPFDLLAPTTIAGYTTGPDYFLRLTVAGPRQVASGNSQRHAGIAGTGTRLEVLASAQFALEVDTPYTHIAWLEIDGNDIPMVGGILLRTNGNGSLLRNLIIHNTRGGPFTGSAVNVSVGADDVDIFNLIAYDFGGDGVFVSGLDAKVANGTFYLGRSPGASSGVRTDTPGTASAYSVLAVGPDTGFRESTPGSLSLYNCISTDTSACDLNVSGSCKTNVPATGEFLSLGGPVNLHLRPRAEAIDFGFDLAGVFNDDIDGQIRPMNLAWDVGADEAALFSGTTNYRSIGTASPYGAGLIDVMNLSDVVNGVFTTWLANNRGRGDVITIPCTDPPACSIGTDYTILAVDSETSLRLTQPYAGVTASGVGYVIRRQFATLQGWEDCISFGGLCTFFPVAGGNLVVEDRSEVGIAYNDSVFLPSAGVDILGSTTDALHTITLTAARGNRHLGISGAGVIVDGQNGPNQIAIRDDYVTIEWLELVRSRGSAVVNVSGTSGPTNVLLRNLLIHDFFATGGTVAGIRLSGLGGKTVTVRNTMIWDGDEFGIEGGQSTDALVIENCSIDDMRDGAARGIFAGGSTVTVTNTIVTRSTTADFDPGTGFFLGSNNTSSDPTAPGGNAQIGVAAGSVFLVPGVDLHLKPSPNPALDAGVNLFPTAGFQDDVDGQLRPVGPGWDRGADELSSGALDLAITKDDGQTTAVPGTPISYAITVTNNGPDPVTSVIVTDPVPAAILGATFSTVNGVYSNGTGDWFFAAPLFVGQSTTLILDGTIDPAATGTLTNTATVFPPPGLTDTVPGNDVASDVDNLTPEADLEILKTDDLDPIDIGNLLTYTLTVTNNGPSDATGVTVTDVLVPELEYQSATPSQGLCSYDVPTRTLTCPLGAMVSGGSAVVTLVVRPTALGTFGNSASVAGNEPDPVPGNNTASQLTTVQTASDGVRFFTVTSTSETNVLEWLNPTTDYVSTEIVFRTDRFPTAPGEPGSTTLYNAGTAGLKDRFVHGTGAGTNNQTHYYAAFVHRSAPPVLSTGRFCSGRPFDTTGSVKWAFSTGAFSITPPTVGGAGVVAPANDRALYAMQRGPLGGEWPTGWLPAQLGGVVQSRSPVIPLPVNGANPVVYLGAQDGNVYTVNGTMGGAAAFPWAPRLIAGTVQAAPAGIFTNWGGAYNYILVGTRDGGADNKMVALNPDTPGNIIGSFDNGGGPGGIGIITGMATVDYATGRLYFTSYVNSTGSNATLWCVQLGSPSPVFTLVWQRALQNIDGSPVVQNGRVYVGSMDAVGTVYSINAATGSALDDRTFVHGDGPVKGFVWPDRASSDLYFATNSFVWGISDTGAPSMPNKFASGISLGAGVTPSTILFVPGSTYVYAGGSDGQLYEIDVLTAAPTLKSQPLGDGQATVGAPSLDWFYNLIHVGTEAGIFYAIQVPLP